MRRVINKVNLAASLAGILNGVLCELEPDVRVEIFTAVARNYCPECGKDIAESKVCHCTNDE